MPFTVRNLRTGNVLAHRGERAVTFWSRFRGLMGRRGDTFGFGEALLIEPCTSIHSFFMRMPIDALFLSPELEVVGLLAPMVPWRVSAIYRRARSVLELPMGTVAGSGTQIGDRLEMS